MKSTENTRALLRHIMMMRQQRRESPSLLSFSGRPTGLKEPDEAQEALQMTETLYGEILRLYPDYDLLIVPDVDVAD